MIDSIENDLKTLYWKIIKTLIQTTQFDFDHETRIYDQKIINENKCKNIS